MQSLFTDRPKRLLLAALAALALGAAGWAMTGDAPQPVDEAAKGANPPLVLGNEALEDRALQAGADNLQDGELSRAKERFADIVAEDPESVYGQIGLILSRWRTIGPAAVENDLEQLAREYPEEPAPHLHIGVVRLLRTDASGAESAFSQARALARRSGGDGVIARRADDLLHPTLPQGYPPLLVEPADVRDARARPLALKIQRAVLDEDRQAAARLANEPRATSSTDPAMAVIRALARFSKDDPGAAPDLLVPGRTPDERSMVELHRGLLLLWASDKTGGVEAMRRAERLAPKSRWGRQATLVLQRFDPS